MSSLARHCPSCKKYALMAVISHQEIICPSCSTKWGKAGDLEKVFETCPVCQNRQFYVQKDFNQALGCLILAIGIVLVPFTYGLSLPIFAFMDWLLHKRVKSIVVCYKCATEFHDFPIPQNFKPFMHHIGLKYDRYR